MRLWMEKWGSVLLIFFCTLVILFSALYTRQDDLKRIAAQNAAADQNETLDTLPRYCPPTSSAPLNDFFGAFQTENGLWQLNPYIHYAPAKGSRVLACCDGLILQADTEQIVLQADSGLRFTLLGEFLLRVQSGDTVAVGQEIASAAAGELKLSLSLHDHYLDPLPYFTP